MRQKTPNLKTTTTLETIEPKIAPETIDSKSAVLIEKSESTVPDHKPDTNRIVASLTFQAWVGVALWMSFGLLMEGFIGYRIPSYFADATRRELFRLAHAHGTLLSLMLLGVAFGAARFPNTPSFAIWAMRIGSVLMPISFLLAGVWHFPGEPGLAIWLVPISALLIIFGAISLALASFKK